MEKLSFLLLFLLWLTASLVLVMVNPQTVDINLYFARHSLQLGLVLILTLILGLVLATTLGGWLVLRYRLRLSRLQRRYDLVYEEVRNLRRMPIHEA